MFNIRQKKDFNTKTKHNSKNAAVMVHVDTVAGVDMATSEASRQGETFSASNNPSIETTGARAPHPQPKRSAIGQSRSKSSAQVRLPTPLDRFPGSVNKRQLKMMDCMRRRKRVADLEKCNRQWSLTDKNMYAHQQWRKALMQARRSLAYLT